MLPSVGTTLKGAPVGRILPLATPVRVPVIDVIVTVVVDTVAPVRMTLLLVTVVIILSPAVVTVVPYMREGGDRRVTSNATARRKAQYATKRPS